MIIPSNIALLPLVISCELLRTYMSFSILVKQLVIPAVALWFGAENKGQRSLKLYAGRKTHCIQIRRAGPAVRVCFITKTRQLRALGQGRISLSGRSFRNGVLSSLLFAPDWKAVFFSLSASSRFLCSVPLTARVHKE